MNLNPKDPGLSSKVTPDLAWFLRNKLHLAHFSVRGTSQRCSRCRSPGHCVERERTPKLMGYVSSQGAARGSPVNATSL